MGEKWYNFWDIIVKLLGFFATAASIYFGFHQFEHQQKIAVDLEFKRNFWIKQNELYVEVCNNAGTMAASIGDTVKFNREKQSFLNLYYGQFVLVEDTAVEHVMVELKAYLEVFEPKDENMATVLKSKVLALSKACKLSSKTFKQAYTLW